MDSLPQPPTPGTPEHDAAMVALAERSGVLVGVNAPAQPVDSPPEAPTPAPIEWPAYLPEKFRDEKLGLEGSLQKLAQSYADLERQRSLPKPPAQAPADKPAPPAVDLAALKAAADALPADDPGKAEAQAKVAAAEAAAVAESAGLSMEALRSEFAESGALSDQSYAALEKAGIDRATVDSYIAGQQALAAASETAAYSIAGGSKESYTAMGEWMKANVSTEELAQYNAAVVGDQASIKSAVAGMWARYQASQGFDPKTISQGNAGPAPGLQGYSSLQDLSNSMRDPRYYADPAYRAQVEARVRATTAF